MDPVSPLVSATDLLQVVGSVTLLDVRWTLAGPDPEAFRAGHLPGAAFVDLDAELASAPGPGGRHPIPTATDFERSMRRLGVSATGPVVVYDDSAGQAAARAWWLLRYFGHPDTRVLDGGLAAWTASGGRLETGDTDPVPGDFAATPGGMPVVGAGDVVSVDVLIDVRAPERFRGEVEPKDPVAGHIPGAVNVPTAWNLDNHGHLKGAADLARTYAEVGATPDAQVAAYCGSGVTAAHTVLALDLAGVPTALYAGSWSEWITDPTRPVALGE
jgi:thiosulfate/3-mercaptopyruvate sulfurtransferase